MRIEIAPSAALAPHRARAVEEINAVAALYRRRYLTDLPGQQMVYLAKRDEARAYLADAAPDMADYPMLAAEVGITAATPGEIAQIWSNLAHLWGAVIGPWIEQRRLALIAAAEAAENQAAIRAVTADPWMAGRQTPWG